MGPSFTILEPCRRSRGHASRAEGARDPQGPRSTAEAKAADPQNTQLARPLAFFYIAIPLHVFLLWQSRPNTIDPQSLPPSEKHEYSIVAHSFTGARTSSFSFTCEAFLWGSSRDGPLKGSRKSSEHLNEFLTCCSLTGKQLPCQFLKLISTKP